MSLTNPDPAFIAPLSADILVAMVRNPNVEPNDNRLPAYAVSQAIALQQELDSRLRQPNCN